MNHTHEPHGHIVWEGSRADTTTQFVNCKCGELMKRQTTPIHDKPNWTNWTTTGGN